MAAIALRVGYSSPSNFCYAFKKRFGWPPRQYRVGRAGAGLVAASGPGPGERTRRSAQYCRGARRGCKGFRKDAMALLLSGYGRQTPIPMRPMNLQPRSDRPHSVRMAGAVMSAVASYGPAVWRCLARPVWTSCLSVVTCRGCAGYLSSVAC
ncbi:AraC family transcriptional regulator [Streptomyces sp. NPDC057575]|uniref:AraC family transcriptional regulator n=1 Tax=Streptomyces sp. NPDC057575 TaxID=3346170 RepID=UPI00369F691B